jgi:SNF2 family DNA or RNA helicase
MLSARLKQIRESKDLALKPIKYLRTHFDHFGQSRELKLRYYQVQAILHLAVCPRFVLGDDTGTGKSLMTIAALCSIWEKDPTKKVVLLTTKSATGQWVSEFHKFTEGITPFFCKGTPAQRTKTRDAFRAHEGPAVLIMGYRAAVQDFTPMQDWENGVLVADECSAFKNDKSRVHQVVHFLAQKASHVWGLSATIIKNALMEGWAIYKIIVPGLLPAKTKFLQNFCITKMQPIGGGRKIPVVVGYPPGCIKQFREIIEPYFLGRAKFEVAADLPVLEQKTIEVQLTDEQEKLYADALNGLLEVGGVDKEVTKLTAVTYCQQVVNHPCLVEAEGDSGKEEALLDLLSEGEEPGELAGEKVIVFTRFRKYVDHLEKVLASKKIKCVRITGAETKTEDRLKAMETFQNPNSGVNVILITMAASDAINLQAAKALVFYDAPFSAGDYLQILGRMIRIGSEHDRVYAIHILSRSGRAKTIDHRVMEILSKKMKLVEEVLGKRIKGDTDLADPALMQESSVLDDLFSSLREDALK